jgi:hypothetical protein
MKRSMGRMAVLIAGMAALLMPATGLAINKNAATTGPTDWTAGGAWVDDGGVSVSKPVAGDNVYIGRAVTGGAVPASIDVTTSEAANHVEVGHNSANGSTLHITASGTLTVSSAHPGGAERRGWHDRD